MRRVLILFCALFAVSVAAFSEQPSFGPRDPGAARQNLSNVDAATGRSALGLGTMAIEASTDYVATDTFTGHTGDASDPHGATLTQTTIVSDSVDGVDVSAHVTDNSDVHGCTAIASASAVADALSAANASDALCVRLDGSRAMTGNLKLGGKWLSNDGGNEGLQVSDGGNVLIGTTSDDGVNKLQVTGGSAFTGDVHQVSGAQISEAGEYCEVFYPGTLAAGATATFTFSIAMNAAFGIESAASGYVNSTNTCLSTWMTTFFLAANTGISGLVQTQTEIGGGELYELTWSWVSANTIQVVLKNTHSATIHENVLRVRILSFRAKYL